MNNSTTPTTTCQICARAIKANTGIIAHHGYQRPQYQGWQTASCDGARQLPYEVSRDYIPVVIERYKMHSANQEAMADEMLRTPPATITKFAMNSYQDDQTFDKPADFDAYEIVNADRLTGSSSYQNEYIRKYRAHRSNVKEIAAAIEFLQKRYADWRAA